MSIELSPHWPDKELTQVADMMSEEVGTYEGGPEAIATILAMAVAGKLQIETICHYYLQTIRETDDSEKRQRMMESARQFRRLLEAYKAEQSPIERRPAA
jgi:hypothetical protein